MLLLGALYATHPELVWLLLAAVCLIAELLTGAGRLVWPAIAAAAVSLLDLAHVRLGWGVELVLWGAISLALGLGFGRLIAPAATAGEPETAAVNAPELASGPDGDRALSLDGVAVGENDDDAAPIPAARATRE